MLKLENLNFSADGKQILSDVNLEIDSGKFIAITGPNGSGKSTLAKLIMGIISPDTGKISFEGQDITEMPINERANLGISFGFQQPVRFKGLTVHDLMNLASKTTISKDDACDVLAMVGLCAKDYLNREVNGSLSGGELKRIEIASVIMRHSKLTIFDEPEAGIDLWSFSSLIKAFHDMQENLSGSIVVISHQERILKIADEVILLNDGKVEKTIRRGEPLESFIGLQDVLATCRKL